MHSKLLKSISKDSVSITSFKFFPPTLYIVLLSNLAKVHSERNENKIRKHIYKSLRDILYTIPFTSFFKAPIS